MHGLFVNQLCFRIPNITNRLHALSGSIHARLNNLRGTHVHGCTCVPKPVHSTAAELEHFVAWFKTLLNRNSLEIAAINQWHADGNRESRGRIPSRISVWACMDCLSIDHASEFQTSRTEHDWSIQGASREFGRQSSFRKKCTIDFLCHEKRMLQFSCELMKIVLFVHAKIGPKNDEKSSKN